MLVSSCSGDAKLKAEDICTKHLGEDLSVASHLLIPRDNGKENGNYRDYRDYIRVI